MKFVIDAQLPRMLVSFLTQRGHEAIHVSELPNGFLTPDSEITEYATEHDHVVISKDSDFIDSAQVTGLPNVLLAVRIGNCTNQELWDILASRWPEIEDFLKNSAIVEVHRTFLVIDGGNS